MPAIESSGSKRGLPRAAAPRKYRDSGADVDSDPGSLTHSATNKENRAAPERRGGNTQITALRKELQEQKRAALEAAKTTAELEVKVAAAAPEIEKLRSKWKSAVVELEAQKQGRNADVVRMAASLANLEGELAQTLTQGSAVRETLSKERNVWRMLSAATGMITLGFLCAFAWHMSRPTRKTDLAPRALQTPRIAVPIQSPPSLALPDDPPAALTAGLGRLNDALVAVPSRSPEQSLRQVTMTGHACEMVWTSNIPSLVFGREPIRRNSLARTLSDCADAVLRLR